MGCGRGSKILQTKMATQLSGRQNMGELHFNGKILTSVFWITVFLFLHLTQILMISIFYWSSDLNILLKVIYLLSFKGKFWTQVWKFTLSITLYKMWFIFSPNGIYILSPAFSKGLLCNKWYFIKSPKILVEYILNIFLEDLQQNI